MVDFLNYCLHIDFLSLNFSWGLLTFSSFVFVLFLFFHIFRLVLNEF